MPESTERELPGWIQEHIEQYLATNGEKGHIWNNVTTLLLTTTGRRTGRSLLLPLIYGRDRGNYLVVASRGGAAGSPRLVQESHRQPRCRSASQGRAFQGPGAHSRPR
jgi:hypothetical protein